MLDVVIGFLAISGAALMLIGAIGIVRLPDVFTRMQATAKAATLGAALVLSAAALHFGDVSVSSRAVAAIAFLLLTAPVAAHLLGRAAYFVGVPLCDTSVRDDLRGQYDPQTHELGGEERDGSRPEGAFRAPPTPPRQ